jgi:sugar lactone lactonase YvrE
MYLGGSIVKIDPHKGQIVKTIRIPAIQTTSLIWGGKDLATLYVTSGANPESTPGIDDVGRHPHDGSIFKIEVVGARGVVRPRYG